MKVSIIIPVLDEAPIIAEAIERAWLAGGDEVIVVDGGSTDDTPQRAAAADCLFVASPRGRGRQQNAGVERASGDALLFLHADNWLVPGGVERIRHALADPRVAFGCFWQRIEATGIAFRMLEIGNYLRAACLCRPYGDQGIFVRREAFAAVGGFPDVPLMEDVLLSQRLARHARPRVLRGPLHVSPRRWRRRGVARQTLHNWSLLLRAKCGVPLARLASEYGRSSNDSPPSDRP